MARETEPPVRPLCGLSLAVLCLGAAVVCGCRSYPKARYAVNDVTVEGGTRSQTKAIVDGIATAETPLFLGFIHRVFDFEVFDRHVLGTDLERIETYYRSQGYYEANVTAARVWVLPDDPRYVNVLIRVEPGPFVEVGTVTVSGLKDLPDEVRNEALGVVADLVRGRPFQQETFESVNAGISDVLADHGHAYVRVKADAEVNIADKRADVSYKVIPGRTAVLGDITLHGNEKIPSSKVLRVFHLEPGDSYSRADLLYARDALTELGVFATVEVRADLHDPKSPVVPVVITVREGDLRSIRAGAGILLNTEQFSASVVGGWESKNFLGGARRFQISGRPSVIFYPTRFPFSGPPGTNEWHTPEKLLFAYRVNASLEQPAFLEGRTTGVFATEIADGPLLFPQPVVGSQVIGFLDYRLRGGLKRKFLYGHLHTNLSLRGELSLPSVFVDATDVPAAIDGAALRFGLGPVVIAYPQLNLGLDYRNDPMRPTRGTYITAQLQYSTIFQWYNENTDQARSRTASDFRIRPVARGYWPVGPFVLAGRIGFGFLFPRGFDPEDIEGASPTAVANQELMIFRGFFSGGPESNRGYAWRQIGPQGFMFYRIPNGYGEELCNLPGLNSALTNNTSFPGACVFGALGGASLWEASFEVRMPLFGPIWGVGFVDSSDVVAETATLGTSPHLSVGPGFRYDTPVGPIRLDFGFRLPGVLGFNCGALSGVEAQACKTAELSASGFPMAVSIAVGDTY